MIEQNIIVGSLALVVTTLFMFAVIYSSAFKDS